MNTADVKIIKMFGPSISDPTKIVNRDVPVCDEQAYKAAGYKRGSIPEIDSEAAESEPPVESPSVPTVDYSSMSKAELAALAIEQGMDVTGMKKADIIELLSAS